ncbi:MAG: hypothetical protein DMF61_07685 [Blastocatellia bacterium AA13]|nr:MAG: hypothetical protein DMF61_07685 [Blastocatellia bacterium AA13]
MPDPAAPDRPLMARREVVSLPSASTLALIRHETAGRKLAPKRVAVIGDPVYDSQDARLGKYSSAIGRRSGDKVEEKSEGVTYAKTAFFQAEALSSDSNEIGSSGGNLRFPRLSFTRQEAADIASLADSKDVMLAMDFRANRETAMVRRWRSIR